MRILVAEDDWPLGCYLERGLSLGGHQVTLARDGEVALEVGLAEAFDLIVLDLSMPQMDGFEVLERMRAGAQAASILVLTGRNGLSDRVRCLDLGADDYLMKPFSFSELTARCRALVRRRDRFQDPVLRHGQLELRRMERRVLQAGLPVELTVKEFALLEYLMLARGRVCARGELLKEVWQMSPDAGTNVVDVYVNYLRKKLDAGGPWQGAGSVIETVRGEGYTLAGTGLRSTVRRPAAGVPVPAVESSRMTRRGLPGAAHPRLSGPARYDPDQERIRASA